MDLREILEAYKVISLELIEEIKQEANTEILMRKRQELLNKIVEMDLPKEEKIRIGKEVNILDVENDVEKVLEEERRKVKEQIREMHIKKQANKGYGANINCINFFSTKV